MSLILVDVELNQRNLLGELGLLFDSSVQGFSFCQPRNYKRNKQTTWNINHLHGLAWSSGKIEFDKFSDVFHDINTLNAEVFVKGLEKCKLASRPFGQTVENLFDYGFPKIQDLIVAEEKRNVLRISSSYPFRHKSRLH